MKVQIQAHELVAAGYKPWDNERLPGIAPEYLGIERKIGNTKIWVALRHLDGETYVLHAVKDKRGKIQGEEKIDEDTRFDNAHSIKDVEMRLFSMSPSEGSYIHQSIRQPEFNHRKLRSAKKMVDYRTSKIKDRKLIRYEEEIQAIIEKEIYECAVLSLAEASARERGEHEKSEKLFNDMDKAYVTLKKAGLSLNDCSELIENKLDIMREAYRALIYVNPTCPINSIREKNIRSIDNLIGDVA